MRIFILSSIDGLDVIFVFFFRRESVPISSLAIWPQCKPVCVYSIIENSLKSCSTPRYSGSRLPGRLVTTFSVRDPIMASQQKAFENSPRPRLYSQLGKIRTSASSGFSHLGARFKMGLAFIGPSQDRIVSLQQAVSRAIRCLKVHGLSKQSVLGRTWSF